MTQRRSSNKKQRVFQKLACVAIAIGIGVGFGILGPSSNTTKTNIRHDDKHNKNIIYYHVGQTNVDKNDHDNDNDDATKLSISIRHEDDNMDSSPKITTQDHFLLMTDRQRMLLNGNTTTNTTTNNNNNNNNNNITNEPTPLVSPWPQFLANDTDFCVPYNGEYNRPKRNVSGIIFVKLHKAASTTGAGITMQIAHHVAQRTHNNKNDNNSNNEINTKQQQQQQQPCDFWWQHGRDVVNRQEPFRLWSWIRNPATRQLSEFFHFDVTRKNITANTTTMLDHFQYEKRHNAQFRMLSTNEMPPYPNILKQPKEKYSTFIQQLLNPYHFIGITERMAESLIVLQMLWGLQEQDMIVLPSKVSGGYDGGGYRNKCFKVQKSFTTPEIDDYLATTFRDNNQLDYMLYDMVNQRLDDTIEYLGYDIVRDKIKRYHYLMDIAWQSCKDVAIFPCAANGTRQVKQSKSNCYIQDVGCGYPCVQEALVQELFFNNHDNNNNVATD